MKKCPENHVILQMASEDRELQKPKDEIETDEKRQHGVIQAASQKVLADQGHADAQYAYSRCLELGTGVAVDSVRSAEYCQRAADQRHSEAQCLYGMPLPLLRQSCFN
jgi:TPR repeat protein